MHHWYAPTCSLSLSVLPCPPLVSNTKLLVFSAPKYCDSTENRGAYINVKSDYKLRYEQFDAVPHPNIRPMVKPRLQHLSPVAYLFFADSLPGICPKFSHVVSDVKTQQYEQVQSYSTGPRAAIEPKKEKKSVRRALDPESGKGRHSLVIPLCFLNLSVLVSGGALEKKRNIKVRRYPSRSIKSTFVVSPLFLVVAVNLP